MDLLIFCHPDDELIFLGPHVDNNMRFEQKLVCLTCRDNSSRSDEFYSFMSDLNITRYEILDLPIIRGFQFRWLRIYYRLLREHKHAVSRIITHTVYGDEHQHPQHVLLALASLVFGIVHKVDVICYGNSKIALKVLLRRTLKAISYKNSIKVTGVLLVKLLLFLIHYIFFKKHRTHSLSSEIRLCGAKNYLSQSLNYEIFNENKYIEYRLKFR